MWEQYEPPGEEPAGTRGPAQPAPPPLLAGGTRSGGGAGILVALVASLAFIGITVGAVGSSDPEPDYSGFYACVAEKNAEDANSLLSPADLCDIGNERPPDYFDDHDYDPFEDVDDGFTY